MTAVKAILEAVECALYRPALHPSHWATAVQHGVLERSSTASIDLTAPSATSSHADRVGAPDSSLQDAPSPADASHMSARSRSSIMAATPARSPCSTPSSSSSARHRRSYSRSNSREMSRSASPSQARRAWSRSPLSASSSRSVSPPRSRDRQSGRQRREVQPQKSAACGRQRATPSSRRATTRSGSREVRPSIAERQTVAPRVRAASRRRRPRRRVRSPLGSPDASLDFLDEPWYGSSAVTVVTEAEAAAAAADGGPLRRSSRLRLSEARKDEALEEAERRLSAVDAALEARRRRALAQRSGAETDGGQQRRAPITQRASDDEEDGEAEMAVGSVDARVTTLSPSSLRDEFDGEGNGPPALE